MVQWKRKCDNSSCLSRSHDDQCSRVFDCHGVVSTRMLSIPHGWMEMLTMHYEVVDGVYSVSAMSAVAVDAGHWPFLIPANQRNCQLTSTDKTKQHYWGIL
eukprot:scaffold124170_cov114-Cyclotella_meneghiniana.AAC.1